MYNRIQRLKLVLLNFLKSVAVLKRGILALAYKLFKLLLKRAHPTYLSKIRCKDRRPLNPMLLQNHYSHNPSIIVSAPVTTLLGGPEMYINKGSTMNLTCIIKHSPEPPPAVHWTHNSEVRRHYPSRAP